jgi:hypothetical protein
MNSLVPMMLVDLGGSPPSPPPFGLTLLRPMASQSGDLLAAAALPPIGLPVPVPVGAFFSHTAGLESEKGERGMELRNWDLYLYL